MKYTTKQLLDKVKALPSFKTIPKDYWILGIRSKADKADTFDDKFYVFKGELFLEVMSGTTNTGKYGLKQFVEYGAKGVAQVVADECYYDVWRRGLHKSKMDALVQVGGFKIIRDNNKNDKSGDISAWTWEYAKGINFHTNSYNTLNKVISWVIGKWSVGCQVINDTQKYRKFLEISKPQQRFTYIILNEF